MSTTLEIELEDGSIANVTCDVCLEDASFDHAFGTKKEFSLEVDDIVVDKFERWDEDGENIIQTVPNAEDVKKINSKVYDKIIDMV